MAGLWYRAGTVAVTNASKKVVGTGTTWKNGVSKPDKGHTVWAPDGKAYELDYVESDTVLYLVTAYGGSTTSGVAYAIDISRSGSNSAFSRDLSAFVAYHQVQMDGWQQLLTGTGDVTLTAPDGTKLTVPSWEKIMNAGSGVVAQAKVDADRAKVEATKAAASATAAGDVVSASALPLPDVWAPLSDSLRLITGYGREVLVGSDVVAAMMSFSRSTTKTYIAKDGLLKVAAANDPAFETEGLLLEGQSTNLVVRSDAWDFLAYNPSAGAKSAVMKSPYGTDTTIKSMTSSADNANGSLVGAVTPPTAQSFSVFFKIISGSGFSLYFSSQGSAGRVVIDAYGSVAAGTDPDTRARVTPLANGWLRVTGAIVGVADRFAVSLPKAASEVAFFGVQMEGLPFASSYIPTSGAAQTRAPDKAWLTAAGNAAASVVVSLSLNSLAPTTFYTSPNVARQIVSFGVQSGVRTGITTYSGQFTCQFSDSGAAQSGVVGIGRVVVAGGTVAGKSAIRAGASTAQGAATKGFAESELYLCNTGAALPETQVWGHVRDLKVWRQTMSMTQIKAIA